METGETGGKIDYSKLPVDLENPVSRKIWLDSIPQNYPPDKWLFDVIKLSLCLIAEIGAQERVTILLGWEKRKGLI